MTRDSEEANVIRRYLLGQTTEEERRQLEEKMMSDNELFERTLLSEDEMVEHYLEGQMSESERKAFEDSFLSTQDGRGQLSFERTLRKHVLGGPSREPQPAPVPQPIHWSREPDLREGAVYGPTSSASIIDRALSPRKPTFIPFLRSAVAAMIVLGLAFGIWRAFLYKSEVEKGMLALAAAYSERPVEARISGLRYAPLPHTRAEQAKVDEVALRQAQRILQDEIYTNASAKAFHALGRLYLSNREFDQAISQFNEALKTDPKNPELHSDLGAALLEKGKAGQAGDPKSGAEYLSQSLDHLNQALDLRDSQLDALFNLGLALEALGLAGESENAWKKYLEKDSQSSWADEARNHLDQLNDQRRRTEQGRTSIIESIVNAYRERNRENVWAILCSNREMVTSELLGAYLSSFGGQSTAANPTPLDALAYAGEIDISNVGDHYTADIAAFYRKASTQGLAKAVSARDLLRQAKTSYERAQLDPALELYTKAQRGFSSIGDKCEAQLATCGLGLTLMEMSQTEQSAALFGTMARDCETSGYRWPRARALFYRSGIEFAGSEYSKAIASAHQACAEAETVNEQSCYVSAVDALIEYNRVLANRTECFGQISLSLPKIKESSLGSIALSRHYGIIALALNTFGLYSAAVDCQLEAVRHSLLIPEDFASLSVAYAHLGLMYGKQRKLEEAFRYLDRAYAEADVHAGERAGREQMAYAALQIGNLRRDSGDYLTALSSYNHSIELYESLNYPTFLYQVFKGRLVCLIAQNDLSGAQQQLTEIMGLMEKHRANIFEEENRNSFFDVEQSVYDLGIDFEYGRMREARKAFEYAESSRARVLLDSISRVSTVTSGSTAPPPAAQPFSIEQIQARIPSDARLLQYAVLEDKVIIWVVSRSGFDHTNVTVSEAEVTETVSRYLAALQDSRGEDDKTALELGRELYGRLIAPVESYLSGIHSLYIVPDKVLNRIPWDALISGDRFLVEDYLVTVSPSATMFAICTDLANQRGGPREERILSVGNPSFDPHEFPRLSPLPDAAREATEIAKMYSLKMSLIGVAAREQTIRDELMKADVAHFAMHCVIDQRSPMHSILILSKEPASDLRPHADGVLQAQEIYDMTLPRTRLVVLSACQTGVERYYRGEGMIGMARAFLVAQVPAVVASLWPVDSEATAELMIRFHEYRKRGGQTTGEALRRAKSSMLGDVRQRHRHTSAWAAFEIIGGQVLF